MLQVNVSAKPRPPCKPLMTRNKPRWRLNQRPNSNEKRELDRFLGGQDHFFEYFARAAPLSCILAPDLAAALRESRSASKEVQPLPSP